MEVLARNQNTSSKQPQVRQEPTLATLARIEGRIQRLSQIYTSEASSSSSSDQSQPGDIQAHMDSNDERNGAGSTESTPTQETCNLWEGSAHNPSEAIIQPRTPSTTSSPSTISPQTMLYTSRSCDPFCGCQCHTLSVARSPAWTRSVTGTLFIGYSGIPYVRQRRCNDRRCKQEGESLVKVTYFFPRWFLARMVTVIGRWNSISGHDIVLKAPRVVSSSSEVFVMAQKGHIRGLQEIFSQGRASIYDVSEGEGRSALHFALTAKKAEVCAFLLSQRISLLTEDKNMLSPIDLVWNYLLQDPTTTENMAIRKAFAHLLDESDDLLKRGFSPLHRIVFGLSKVDLEDHLRLSTADIDTRCSLGRTPLCWAALRRDANHVRSLVRFGASLDLADNRGQSPFHFAAETGVFESLKVLLTAAANLERVHNPVFSRFTDDDKDEEGEECFSELENPTASAFCLELIERRDYKGRTPLHFATRVNHVEHASLLLHHGANVDSPDTPLERTPLLLAIYWNSHEVLSLLLSKNARTDVMDSRSCTILHYAARFGDAQTLGILSEVAIMGISPDCTDFEGRAPLEAFDHDRPFFIVEDEEVAGKNRETFEHLLHSVKMNLFVDSDRSDIDIFFDVASSLEAPVAIL